MAIDFTLSAEQKALQSGARAFAREVLTQVGGVIAPIAPGPRRASSPPSPSTRRWRRPASCTRCSPRPTAAGA